MTTGPSGKSVNETLTTERSLNSVATAGLRVLDANATLTFTLYQRVVLPADGFVFWVRADQLNYSALFNTSPFNSAAWNAGQTVRTPAAQFDAAGSLHHATTNTQDEDSNFSTQRMVFTSEVPVNELTAMAPGTMYIADWEPGLRFAFSRRNAYYVQAGLFHYEGDALYAPLATQIIDNPAQLTQEQIISNSLPIWLTLAAGFFPLYPSYLVPDNVQMPYGSVHIGEDDTSSLQPDPYFDLTGSRWQLAKDRVRVTTYGVRNGLIYDWLDSVDRFTLDNPGVMGLMGPRTVRDAKRSQVEFNILAQKKIIEFEVDYYQQRIRDLSLRYIKKAFLSEIYPFAAA